MKQIKGELDIYNYMRRLRMTQSTVNALTNFNQRRLLEAQVETSFLLRPLGHKDGEEGKGKNGKKGRKHQKSESSSEESEEDFAFLENDLRDNQELDEIS